MEMIDITHAQEIYTVTRLNREVKFLLEDSFPFVWIEGEISGFKAHSSGHWYFCLKDAGAQVRCAMFRGNNFKLRTLPQDGMHVIVKARVSLYENRGDYQLYVEHLEEAGIGKLQQEFEALKKKLSAAGLFDPAHKKPLPKIPRCIGVVTSPTGAAIRDILSVLKRRSCSVPIIIYPTLVQGNTAAPQIVKAIETANRRKECDVLIIARGGGSLEDLWPFNEERVAHAIFQSEIPTISGVGHEIDFTIADFVADMRAPTPSAAAELVAPACEELLQTLFQEKRILTRHVLQKLQQFKQHILWMQKHLQQQHPKRKLDAQHQQLDHYEIALIRLQNKLMTARHAALEKSFAELYAKNPMHFIRNRTLDTDLFLQKIKNEFFKIVQQRQKQLSHLAGKLDAMSPLATLQRGYAIVTHDKDGNILREASKVKAGDKVQVKLMQGSLSCVAEKIINSNSG